MSPDGIIGVGGLSILLATLASEISIILVVENDSLDVELLKCPCFNHILCDVIPI